MNTALQPQFNNTPVAIIDHNGKRWLTSAQVGICLGYAPDHARTSINKLYARHVDEFTLEDSTEVKLTSPQGTLQNTRIFSDTGCIKLAFFANTKASKDFRHFASQTLAAHNAINQDVYQHLHAAQREILRLSPRLREVQTLLQAGFSKSRSCQLLQIGETTLRGDVNKLKACGLAPTTANSQQQVDLFGGDL
ncbi:MAG: hypothetical protein Q7U38_14200 [Methylobacter sp.]|nr:hypothetical protein [Methylobacter sp.]MDP2169649.1 hypothetical protein [Rhodocyclaceae bacterium]MDP2429038.1 hypothetical protein [Methylobacter sp.]MDP3056539.1 hypothetical protein [Methylobacter sp.]MDP3362028.1 hypothetical protein [Methylobacter sp.]